MQYNMKEWLKTLPDNRRPLPLLSFPSSQLIGESVYRITHDAAVQAKGIVRVAQETDAAAAVCMMDLSVEAEAFGCTIIAEENEIPTVVGALITDEDEANALEIPMVGASTNRTGLYVEAAKIASAQIIDRPVLAGIIGPFSLAGRLMDVQEALVNCLADEDFMIAALEKSTEFLIQYALAYKDAGINGLVMAEPLSGLLSPALEETFSAPYVKRIIDAVQDDDFIVIYHNCGPNTPQMTKSFVKNGASAYHFGDAVDMKQMLESMPANIPVCGNISPSAQFLSGTPESMTEAVHTLMAQCGGHKNFVLSSGCDIPPAASWDNIHAFFAAAEDAVNE